MTDVIPASVSEGQQFWYQHLGRFLSDQPVERTGVALVPTRLNRGVAPHRLGSKISAFYIVTLAHAWVIGKLEMDDTENVTFIPSDGPNALRGETFIAEWLASDRMTTPCMIGVLGDASPDTSFEISRSARRVVFCQPNKSYAVDADALRAAKLAIGERSWWDEVRPALLQYFVVQKVRASGMPHQIERENAKMLKLLGKTPGLAGVLKELDVRAGSGEFRQLDALFSKFGTSVAAGSGIDPGTTAE